MERIMRVIVTGGGTSGHVNPAISIADMIKQKEPDSEFLFVGTDRGIENKLVPKAGYKLAFVNVRGIRRSLSPSNIKSLYLALTSPHKAKKLIREFKPDIAIGTGGYVSWPVMKAAASMGIPTLIHESNSYPGVAVRMLAGCVDRILVNFEATKELLPEKYRSKVVRTGNPLREEFLSADKERSAKALGISGKYRKFLLACGGSMGAEKINLAVLELMRDYGTKHPEMLIELSTGSIEYEATKSRFKEYGLEKYPNLKLYEYIYDMPARMAAADAVINRAGAMTLSELAALGKPSILIPSPNVTDNHQYKNAHELESHSAAILIEEKALTEKKLEAAVDSVMFKGADKTLSEAIKAYRTPDTKKLIYDEICNLIYKYKSGKKSKN